MSVNPYAEALGGLDPRAVMAETPGTLAEIVGAMSAEEMDARPAPDKWSVREVLVHLADCELSFGFRLRQVYGGQRVIQPFDQDAWARGYGVYTAAQAMETFRVLRAWNIAFVDGLTEDDKEMEAFHPERGEMVLWTVVETIGGHDRHHLKALAAR